MQERARRAEVFIRLREDREEELTGFTDLFSRGAAAYAAHRPRYPRRLFAELASHCPRRELAWDCATGNGQAAVGLAELFTRVVATDASAAQIAAAMPHERVTYRVAPAHVSGLASHAVDLVTVAQALHWLDRDSFFREATRVLASSGVVAVWCYGLVEVDARIDQLVRHFYDETLSPYWAPERRLVDEGYRFIDFPFDEFELPPLAIEQAMTLDQLGDYLRTWSAVQRSAQERHEDPVTALLGALAPVWGSPANPRQVRWPLFVRAGKSAA